MSKIWRCPECETLNQGKKCVICGYEIPGKTENIPKKDQEPEIKPQPRKNECEQTSLKMHDDNDNVVLEHHSSDKSVPSRKSKSLFKVIAAGLAAVAVLGIAFLVKSFLPQNNDPEKNISTDKEQILTAENETYVNDVTTSTLMSATENTETTIVVTFDEDNTDIDSQKLSSEIISVVNGQRVKNNVPPLKYESKAEEIADDILKDVVAGTYVKGTSMDYAYGKFDNMQCYYEEKFDFTSVISETEAAEMLLKYEAENFSNNWLDEIYDYIGSAVYDYGDGKWGIVFTLCYNDEVQTTTAKAGIIIPDYRGLSVDEYTAELKRLGIPYQVLMEQSEDVSEGYVVSIDGGIVGEYYEGIHIITVYEAYSPQKRGEYITIKGKKYSTDLTELDLSGLALTDEDIKPLTQMVKLTSLDLSRNHIRSIDSLKGLTNLTYLCLWNNQINDISSLERLTRLTALDLIDNQISDISSLKNLTNLTNLYLSFNQISDISSIKGLTNLTELYLAYNQITYLGSLKGLKNLNTLSLNGTPINDITPLRELSNLKNLYLSVTQISEVNKKELQKALPDCNIEY